MPSARSLPVSALPTGRGSGGRALRKELGIENLADLAASVARAGSRRAAEGAEDFEPRFGPAGSHAERGTTATEGTLASSVFRLRYSNRQRPKAVAVQVLDDRSHRVRLGIDPEGATVLETGLQHLLEALLAQVKP